MAVEETAFPFVPDELRERASRWGDLKRWERRELAQELRRFGLSYGEIATVIPVARASLSGWCRDIQLTTAQAERVAAKRPSLRAMRENGHRRRAAALAAAEEIRNRARRQVRYHVDDPVWVAGLVAYWSEGAKKHGSVRFSNSDPALIALFLLWAQRYLAVTKDRFTIALHLHTGQEELERIRYWSDATGIHVDAFGRTFIKPEGTGHRKNVLYNGTASVRVRRSGALLQQVLGWIEGYASSIGQTHRASRYNAPPSGR